MEYKSIIQTERLKIFEVADGIYAAISPYRGISWANAAFITKGPGLVYDTFFDLFHANEMKDTFIKLTGKKPEFVINSHHDPDHNWGNKAFNDSTIIMHKEATKYLNIYKVDWWDNVITKGKDSPELNDGERFLAAELEGFDLTGVESARKPDIELDGDIMLRLGDTEAHVLNVAPCHSDADLMVWLPKEKVLFVGDVLFDGAGATSEEGIRNSVKVLDRILNELKPEVIIPGHGGIVDLDFVAEIKDYYLNLLEEFDKYYTDDISAVELAKKIDVSRFLHMFQPERIVTSVLPMISARKGERYIPDWNKTIPESLIALREFHKEKYGDLIQTKDPFYVWEE